MIKLLLFILIYQEHGAAPTIDGPSSYSKPRPGGRQLPPGRVQPSQWIVDTFPGCLLSIYYQVPGIRRCHCYPSEIFLGSTEMHPLKVELLTVILTLNS